MWLKILLKQWICYFSEVSWGLDTKPNNKFWLGRSWYRRPTMISATIGWTRMHSPFTLILTLCPHFTTQLPTADQFCSEGWEVSLLEVPACLTVVAMVGGHGQAKKEGANCQVGRCFFGMTVALGGVSTAWRKQEWRGARWRLGRRLRRRRSRFPALWKKEKLLLMPRRFSTAKYDCGKLFVLACRFWQMRHRKRPLICGRCLFGAATIALICCEAISYFLVVACRSCCVKIAPSARFHICGARFKQACVKFFSTCYEEHDWGFEEAGTLVRCKSPQSRPCRSTRSSPATSWIDQMIMKEEWEKTSGFDMSIWWHDDIESVGWPQQGLRRRRILLWEPPIARCRKTSRSRPWNQPSWFWWEKPF